MPLSESRITLVPLLMRHGLSSGKDFSSGERDGDGGAIDRESPVVLSAILIQLLLYIPWSSGERDKENCTRAIIFRERERETSMNWV